MNKTVSINLGGFPFNINEDAYDYIHQYLESIRHHFSNSEGCDEILYDIEVRMAELFQEHLKGRTIVSMKEVDEVIQVMGKPEDFGAESIDQNTAYQTREKSQSKGSIKMGKRLFRNPDDQKLAGVCSGIAAYFGIEDPVWIRLLFVLFTFFGGFGVMTYLIFWFVVPEAVTSSDKLAMKGEPTTVENIAKKVEEEISELGDRISEWGKEFGSKKKRYR